MIPEPTQPAYRFSKWTIVLMTPGGLLLLLILVGTQWVPERQAASIRDFEVAETSADVSIESPTEAKFRDYLALETYKALEEPPSLQPDVRKVIQLAVERIEKAQSYSSRRIVTDQENGHSVEWRMDFVKPDKLHIARTANGVTDDWVKIGEARHYSSPPSLPTDSREWENAEQKLRITDAVDSLRRLMPAHGASYRVHGKRYLWLEYEDGLQVWIDLSTNLISKTEVIGTNKEVRHVFAAFDEPIVISAPSNKVVRFHP
jgi:hypothetical protein